MRVYTGMGRKRMWNWFVFTRDASVFLVRLASPLRVLIAQAFSLRRAYYVYFERDPGQTLYRPKNWKHRLRRWHTKRPTTSSMTEWWEATMYKRKQKWLLQWKYQPGLYFNQVFTWNNWRDFNPSYRINHNLDKCHYASLKKVTFHCDLSRVSK